MVKDLFPSTHPLTPPHHEEDWLNWLRLLRSRRVGPSTFFKLMHEHKTAAQALKALPDVARAAGVTDYRICDEASAIAEMKAGKQAGAQLIAFGSREYPALLTHLKDAPPLLWALGNIKIFELPMVAVVGARNASSLGTRMARRLADGLSGAGFVVVSGLARGVDAAAHVASVDRGTLAVMAGGVDVVYPSENAVIAQEIADKGLRISELPMGLRPIARHFPQRNRIISGLCRGVVVVEAAANSGSLITARAALDQGREVLSVPGHPFDGRAFGNNCLIRDGATLVRSVADIIDVIGPAKMPVRSKTAVPIAPSSAPSGAPPKALDQARLHSDILARLGPSPLAEDQLIRDLKLPASTVAPALVNLELDGKINRQAGGLLNLA